MRIVEAKDLPPPAPASSVAARYLVGLDLGSAQDYSALAILEQHGHGQAAEFLCRHLQRWPLRTPYTAIAADTSRLVNCQELQGGSARTVLAVDMNGPGTPVLDLLKTHPLNARVEAIFSHGGDQVTSEGNVTRVPKRELVSTTQIALQTGRLKIAPTLAEAPTLVRELQNYQVEISAETAHDSYGAWRAGTHDDLLFAVMLPLWFATGSLRPTMAVLAQGKAKVRTKQLAESTLGRHVITSRAAGSTREEVWPRRSS